MISSSAPTPIQIPLGTDSFGRALRYYRLQRTLTQAELAVAAHCEQQTISEYEGGKVDRIDVGIVLRLSHALGVNLLAHWRGGSTIGTLPLPATEEVLRAARAA